MPSTRLIVALESVGCVMTTSGLAPDQGLQLADGDAWRRVLWDSGVVETPIDGVDQLVIQEIFVAMSLASKERS
jgi:hypothetical protein